MTGKLPILVAHGVNLDRLGVREPDIYGTLTVDDINKALAAQCQSIVALTKVDLALDFRQTNVEAEFMSWLTEKDWTGAILNPAAWTHTSLALGDRLASVDYPYVEVHISNISAREPFRRKSYGAPHAAGVVYGLGANSYIAGLYGLAFQLAGLNQ